MYPIHLSCLWLLLLFSATKLNASPTSMSFSSSNRTIIINDDAAMISTDSTGSSTHLTPRELPFPVQQYYQELNADWNAASQEAQALLPTHQSADLLADFYHSVLSMCTAMIAGNVPFAPYGGSFMYGALSLHFDSIGGAISWALVRAFADWMLLTTAHGFTSTYTLWLNNHATGHAVRFTLKAGQ